MKIDQLASLVNFQDLIVHNFHDPKRIIVPRLSTLRHDNYHMKFSQHLLLVEILLNKIYL